DTRTAASRCGRIEDNLRRLFMPTGRELFDHAADALEKAFCYYGVAHFWDQADDDSCLDRKNSFWWRWGERFGYLQADEDSRFPRGNTFWWRWGERFGYLKVSGGAWVSRQGDRRTVRPHLFFGSGDLAERDLSRRSCEKEILGCVQSGKPARPVKKI